ncbi:hypothetical protein [Sinomonas albida]|uniref:hypothetical protein n=1 Tax=Sinomonas albida TaxID=369942 RepID=UPI0010A93BB8|nr:hypothetical protein [Sinomonas albida]
MAGRSLEGLCAALELALGSGDADALCSLYLPTAVIALGVGDARLESTPEAAAVDRVRLGLPIELSVRRLDSADDVHGEVVVDWSLSGLTTDGTELDLAGEAVLECTLLGGDWYVAAEEVRCYERARLRGHSQAAGGR